jgi:periplasmic protein TonB
VNTALWRYDSYGPRYTHCWMVSILLHGTAIGLAVGLLSDLRLAAQPDAFRWQVSVVGTTSAPDVQATATAPMESHTVPRTPPTPAVNKTAAEQRKAPIPRQPVMPTAIDPQPPSRVTVDIQEHSVMEQIQPAPQAAPPPNLLPQVTAPADSSQSAPFETATLTRSASSPPAEESAHTASTALTPPTSSSVPAQEPAVTPSRDTAIAGGVPLETTPAVASMHPDIGSSTGPSPDLSPPVQEARRGKPDFSWLADSLRNKVKESQQYSTVARLNGMEGRVVLRITVNENGDLAVAIAKSSGHERLDQDALEQVKRLSPLPLPQPLGRAQQVLNLPIIYSLNQ